MKNYVFKLLKKYDYDWNKIDTAMRKWEIVIDSEVEQYDNYENFTSIFKDDYPEILNYTNTPPFAVFYKGDLNDFKIDEKTTLIPSFHKNVSELEKKLLKKGEKVIIVHACGRDNSEWDKDNKKSLGITIFLDDEKETEKRINQTVKFIKDLEHIKGKISKNLNIEEPPTKRTKIKKKDISILVN